MAKRVLIPVRRAASVGPRRERKGAVVGRHPCSRRLRPFRADHLWWQRADDNQPNFGLNSGGWLRCRWRMAKRASIGSRPRERRRGVALAKRSCVSTYREWSSPVVGTEFACAPITNGRLCGSSTGCGDFTLRSRTARQEADHLARGPDCRGRYGLCGLGYPGVQNGSEGMSCLAFGSR